jgi:hypothetical protein
VSIGTEMGPHPPQALAIEEFRRLAVLRRIPFGDRSP